MPRQSSTKKSSGGSSRKKATQKQADAVDILKADHETVMSLFRRHDSASPEERETIAKEIFTELEIHSTVEEEIFYPALREQRDLQKSEQGEADESDGQVDGQDLSDLDDDEGDEEVDGEDHDDLAADEMEEEEGEDLVSLAYEDHKAIRDLIHELRGLDPASEQYGQRFDELQEAVTDHAGEEEEVLFPEAKLKLDTKQLGAEIAKRRSELATSMAA